MKPQLKTNLGSQKEKYKSSERGEVSISFQDELAATIHGAFEVALEIAILEVTKLVGQALGDVRDQMHETLRENKSLKLRLQTAEEERDAVRGLSDGDGQPLQQFMLTVSKSANRSPSPENSNALKRPNDNDLKIQASLEVTVDKALNLKHFIVEKEISSEEHNGYFSEICADGRVCSQDLHPTSSRESVSLKDTLKGAKEETSNLFIEDKSRTGSADDPGQDTEFTDDDNPSLSESLVQNPLPELVRVKEEKKEVENSLGSLGSSSCRFASVRETNFCPDSLSLVQSKMLEEWRPDALVMQNPDSLVPGTSHTLSHSSMVQPAVPDLRVSTACSLPAFSTQFPNLFQPEEPTAIPASPQLYGAPVMTSPVPTLPATDSGHTSMPYVHVCKICGQVFQQPSELRRHNSQCQQRLHQQRSKLPPGSATRTRHKLQLYPPGRSPFHCTICGRDFNRMENLKTHLRIHTGERPYSCSVCAMPFRHSGALTRHFRIHTGEKPYVCSQCGKRFRNCGGLRFHQRSHGADGK